MKQLFFLLLSFALIVILAACSGEKKDEVQTQTESAVQTDTMQTDMTKAKCPSCGMVMDKTAMVTYVSQTDTLYFCSEDCQKHYLAKQDEGHSHEEGSEKKNEM